MLAFLVAALLVYTFLVRQLRFRRRDAMSHRFRHNDHQGLGEMSLEDAYEIQLSLAELEFPMIISTPIFFALFKTHGIPSISNLLTATGELSDATKSSKRAADTGVLLTEIVLNRPGSPRNLAAIARMNWLHDRYCKSGRILDADMLYTLSLFVLEPVRWTRRFEWRTLTDLERCAMAVYWKNLGDVMNISVEPKLYDETNTTPARSNNTLDVATIAIGLTNVPSVFCGVSLQFVSALLDPHLRQAMMLQEPSWLIKRTLNAKLFVKNLALPRPYILRVQGFTSHAHPRTGRFHFLQYIGHPWYVEQTLVRRWRPISWLLWLVGGSIPSPNHQFRPQGYTIADLGPTSLEGKGIDQMELEKIMISSRFHACPFSPPFLPE